MTIVSFQLIHEDKLTVAIKSHPYILPFCIILWESACCLCVLYKSSLLFLLYHVVKMLGGIYKTNIIYIRRLNGTAYCDIPATCSADQLFPSEPVRTRQPHSCACISTGNAAEWGLPRLPLLLFGSNCFIKSHETRSVDLSSTRTGAVFTSLTD